MSISARFTDLRAKAASNRRTALLSAFIFLSATVSFSAGYLTAQDSGHSPIVIEKCSPGTQN